MSMTEISSLQMNNGQTQYVPPLREMYNWSSRHIMITRGNNIYQDLKISSFNKDNRSYTESHSVDSEWCNISHSCPSGCTWLDILFHVASDITMWGREVCEDMLGAMRMIIWGDHVEQRPCSLDELLGESVKQMLNLTQQSVRAD